MKILNKKILNGVVLFVAVVFMAGCSTPHVITMKDGKTVTTKNTPEMNSDGFYEYKTPDGVTVRINGSEVLEIHEIKD